MVQFQMKIAEKTAGVISLFDSTPQYFRAYLTEDAPDFYITVNESDLRFQQAQLDQEALEEGFRLRVFTDPFLERAAIQQAFAEFLFDYNTLLLHGSTIAVDGNAYLFTAKSGTGKSTHTRLWREVFGPRAIMINDDKPFIKISDSAIEAFGSPWSGKHGLDTNISLPLSGICLLERGVENEICATTPEILLPMLIKQTYAPENPDKHSRLHTLVTELAQKTPLWHLFCNKSPEAAQLAYETMAKKSAGTI